MNRIATLVAAAALAVCAALTSAPAANAETAATPHCITCWTDAEV